MSGSGAGRARELVVVDGYNLIARVPEYSEIAERDMDAAREKLLADASTLVAPEREIVVVFDGGGNPASDGLKRDVASLGVIFSKAGEDADTKIESLAFSARAEGRSVLVVTSDLETVRVVEGGGVRVLSVERFASDLSLEQEDWRERLAEGKARSSVEDRLDPATRESLRRWAREGRP